ncbi:MAG TPA: glycosyltransferase [Bacteroidia bacterium]
MKLDKPLISVLLPVYNSGKYLSKAIESVLNQTYSNFELLLINDGSTDSSKKIVESFSDPRIRFIDNPGNKGLIYVLNQGLSLAEGKYIARMDADDICYPDRFQKQIDFLEQHQDHGICGTHIRVIDGGEIIKRPLTDEDLRWWIFKGSPLAHPSVMMKKEIFVNHGLQYNTEAYLVEDFDLWWRMSLHCKMANLDEVLLAYRIHSEQESSKAVKQSENLYKNLNEFIENIGISTQVYSSKFISDALSKNIKFVPKTFILQYKFFSDLLLSKQALTYFGKESINKKFEECAVFSLSNLNHFSMKLTHLIFDKKFREFLKLANVSASVFVLKCVLNWKTKQ